MEGTLVIFALIGLAFIIFNIYFIFKILQFVIMAINLYKKMIIRQDATIHLLLDIRDDSKNYDKISKQFEDADEGLSQDSDEGLKICDKCKIEVPVFYKKCPKCGNKFE